MNRRLRSACCLLPVMSLLAGGEAVAWTRPGHMVSAAIAYDELIEEHPQLVDRIVQLLAQHPDRGPFEVAVDRTIGDPRARRIFMEMARWPDDVRGGAYDHPTWHYSVRPLVDAHNPPQARPVDSISGSAFQAFALNASVVADERAPPSERAVALCWLFHLVGDIHQPLHATEWYSSTYPQGDRGGSRQYVLDPQTQQPITLHWYWDDSVHRAGDPALALERAKNLEARYPRTAFGRAIDASGSIDEFKSWARESYELAGIAVYRSDLSASPTATAATREPSAYIADSSATAEKRLTLAGYRLANVLISLLGH